MKLGDDNIKEMMNAENAKEKCRNKNGDAASRSNGAGEQKKIAEGGKNKHAEESSICGRPHSLQNLPLYSKSKAYAFEGVLNQKPWHTHEWCKRLMSELD